MSVKNVGCLLSQRAFNGAMQPKASEEAREDFIECRVTPWYFKRMGMLAAMLVVFSSLFFYDGQWGYAAKNAKADVKDRFEDEVLKGYDDAKANNSLDAWRLDMKSKNWPVDVNGQPPKWMSYAAEHGMDEKPKRYSDKEIAEQFWWGGAMAIGALIVGVLVLLNKGKVLRGYSDHFVTPEGVAVRHEEVFKIDKRKWDNKGLAYAHFKKAGGGSEQRAVIDDLKYDGAAKVLDCLLSQFSGELIEKVVEPEEEETIEKPADS